MILKKVRDLLCLSLLPLAVSAQQPEKYETSKKIDFSANTRDMRLGGYEISGQIAGLEEGEKVTMCLSNARGKEFHRNMINRDSAYVKNGKFHIKGHVPEGPRRYWMIFDRHTGDFVNGKLTASKVINLYIDENEKISISSKDVNKIPHSYIQHYVKVEGSPTNNSMLTLEPVEELYYQSVGTLNNYVKNLQDSIGFDKKLLDGIFASRELLNQTYYYNIFYGSRDPELEIVDFVLPTDWSNFKKSGHAAFWMDVYKNLPEKKKNTFYGKWMKEQVKLCVGQPLPDFILPTENGNSLRLKEVAEKSKVTIVQFWSTNSDELEGRQNELAIMFKKYHDQGLNVIGVSADTDINKWKEALRTSKYPWYNVLDKGGKLIDSVYHELGEPGNQSTTNVLIDEKGEIIAWGVEGIELQWYLLKQFGEN